MINTRKEAQENEEAQKKCENSYESKALHKLFKRETWSVRGGATKDWLKKGYLKKKQRA